MELITHLIVLRSQLSEVILSTGAGKLLILSMILRMLLLKLILPVLPRLKMEVLAVEHQLEMVSDNLSMILSMLLLKLPALPVKATDGGFSSGTPTRNGK